MCTFQEWYITPQEYETAKQNGISRKLVDERVRNLGWDKEKAISVQPKKLKRFNKEMVKLAEMNGISYDTFRFRVRYYGWDEYRAATEPKWDKDKFRDNLRKVRKRKYPKELLELAEKNGIYKDLFYSRVNKLKMSPEDSATTPVKNIHEIAKMGAAAYEKIYGHKFSS